MEKGSGKIVLLSSRGPKSTTSHVAATVLYPDDLAIASDGGVYFSDSTDIPPTYSPKGFYDVMESFMLSLVQVCAQAACTHSITVGRAVYEIEQSVYSINNWHSVCTDQGGIRLLTSQAQLGKSIVFESPQTHFHACCVKPTRCLWQLLRHLI